MPISYVGGNVGSGNSSVFSCTEPGGCAADDVALVFGMQHGASRTITPPSPFTLVNKLELTGSGYFLYRGVRTGSAFGSSWTSTVDDGWILNMVVYRGVDTTTPIEDWEFANATSTSVTWPAVTTTRADSVFAGSVMSAGHMDVTGDTWTNDRIISSGADYYTYDETVASPGSSGTNSLTITSGAVLWCAMSVALNPAGPVATLTQEGFRWRADDGSETTATWLAAQDSNP